MDNMLDFFYEIKLASISLHSAIFGRRETVALLERFAELVNVRVTTSSGYVRDGITCEPEPIERLRLPFLLPLQSERRGKIGELFREAEREWVPGGSCAGSASENRSGIAWCKRYTRRRKQGEDTAVRKE